MVIYKDYHIDCRYNTEQLDELIRLADGSIVNGSVEIYYSDHFHFPRIAINGSLRLYSCRIEYLPDDLQVERDVDLTGCRCIMVYPDSLTNVNGDLSVERCISMVYAPPLTVGGNLFLSGCGLYEIVGTVQGSVDYQRHRYDEHIINLSKLTVKGKIFSNVSYLERID